MKTTSVILRKLTSTDLPYLEAYFPEPKPGMHAVRVAGQSKGHYSYFCVEIGGKIAGIILVRWRGPVNPAHLSFSSFPEIGSEYILPEFRKQGLATQLLHHSEEIIKKQDFKGAGLLIRDNNLASIAFHTKEGYRPVGAAQKSNTEPHAPRKYYVKFFSK